MADAELPVFVAAHSIHLAFGSQKQSVKDAALDLLDLMAEINEYRSSHFLRPVHSKLSIFVRAASEYVAFTIDEATVHCSTRKISNSPFDIDSGW